MSLAQTDRSHGPRLWVAAIVLLVCTLPIAGQTPARDAVRVRTGTAVIAGRVVTGQDGSVPVRRARVTLASTEGSIDARTATTDDEGAFEFGSLPAGRFTIEVVKTGFLRGRYGAAKPGRAGSPVSVADGARVAGLLVPLVRGAAITGTVRDEQGRPLADVPVFALRLGYSWLGDRTIGTPSRGAFATTDDRGMFRVWDLPAGEYLVEARPAVGLFSGPGSRDFIRLRAADVDRVLGTTGIVISGAAGEGLAISTATVNYASVFHPGTFDPGPSSIVSVADAGEVLGIDIVVSLAPTARVTGVVRQPDGRVPATMQVTLNLGGGRVDHLLPGEFVRPLTTRTDTEGRFSFADVPPGRHSVLVRPQTLPAPGQDSGAIPLWARTSIDVSGAPVDVQLDLQPAMTVNGRIVFEGASIPPVNLSDRSFLLIPSNAGADLSSRPAGGQVSADGTFSFTGVMPDRYRLVQVSQQQWSGDWGLQAMVADGLDALDGFTVEPGANVGLVVTYTDRPSGISGTFVDASGRPAPEYFIVVFPVNEASRRSPQRVRHTRPASDGVFEFRALPAGEYFLAALTDLLPEDLFGPSFMHDISHLAVRVTVEEGRITRRDLRIGQADAGATVQ